MDAEILLELSAVGEGNEVIVPQVDRLFARVARACSQHRRAGIGAAAIASCSRWPHVRLAFTLLEFMGASHRVHVCSRLYHRHDPGPLSHSAWELTSSRSGCFVKDRERERERNGRAGHEME